VALDTLEAAEGEVPPLLLVLLQIGDFAERPGMATFLIKFLLAVSTLLYRPCPRCLSLMA